MSRRAPRTAFLALFTLFMPLLALSAPPALEDVIPADASIVVLVDDLPGLREELPSSPLMRAWEDPAIRAAILQFSGLEELPDLPVWLLGEEESDAGSDDPHVQLLNSLTGQVAIMFDLEVMDSMQSEDDHLPSGFSLLAQIEGHEKAVADLLSSGGGDEAAAESATTVSLPAGTWKIARGVLAISGAPDGAEALVAALEGASETAPLSTGAGFQTMRRHAANSDLEVLVNLAPVMDLAQKALDSEEGALPDNPLGIAPQDLLRGLGLDVFRSMWFSLRLSPEVTESTGGITFAEERGLIRLAAFQPLPAGRHLPLPAEAIDASTFMFDFSAAWKAALEITTDISPVIGAAMEAQIVQMSAQLGIDLGKEIPG
ncbi:MAG: hypothetical protein O7D35_05795, partial [Acidobacteria bacterium]|nr:hypothetical protein [Acidobacteriota bacterium]